MVVKSVAAWPYSLGQFCKGWTSLIPIFTQETAGAPDSGDSLSCFEDFLLWILDHWFLAN